MRIASPKILKDQIIPKVEWTFSPSDLEYIKQVEELIKKSQSLYESYDIRGAIGNIPRIWNLCNKLVTDYEPWKLKNDHPLRNKVIYLVLETVRNISILLYPCLATLMKDLNSFMNIKAEFINSSKLGFRAIDEKSLSSLTENFSFEKSDVFFRLNPTQREKVFQQKLELTPKADVKA